MITFVVVFMWIAYLLSLFFVVFWFLVLLSGDIEDKKKTIKRFPLVSIIIPAYNEEKSIKKTLKSVLDLEYPHDKLEIIVINDGSKDKTKEMVEQLMRYHPDRNINLINQINQGKGKSMNNALKIAKGEFFVCLDADSFVDKHALKIMVPHFDDDQNLAAVLPFMKVKSPRTLIQKIQWCEYIVNFFYKRLMGKLDCIHVTPGPFAVYRTAILKKLGGFSENNLTEDLEVCLRLQKNHYKILQLMDAVVYTIAPSDLSGFYKQRNRWYKGSLFNSIAYKDLMFNKKYGDFGIFQMPQMLLMGILALSVLLISSYNFILKPFLIWLRNMSFVNYDVPYFFNQWVTRSSMMDMVIANLFLTFFALAMTFVIVYYAHKYAKENLTSKGFYVVPAYMVFYTFLIMFAWTGVFFDILRGKRQKW